MVFLLHFFVQKKGVPKWEKMSGEKEWKIGGSSLFELTPRFGFTNKWNEQELIISVVKNLAFFEKEWFIWNLAIVWYTLSGEEDIPVIIDKIVSGPSWRLAFSDFEYSIRQLVIRKDFQFIRFWGELYEDSIKAYLSEMVQAWEAGKIMGNMPPEKEKQLILDRFREEWYKNRDKVFEFESSNLSKDTDIFIALLSFHVKWEIALEPLRFEDIRMTGEIPSKIVLRIVRPFWPQISHSEQGISKHDFEYDFSREELKYNGRVLVFKKKNLEFLRVFFDLLKEWNDHISTDDVMVWVDEAYVDKMGDERHKGKKTHIYYPRSALNKSILEQTWLSDFFRLENENIFLNYFEYMRYSKNF
jgi:hypothetical protein